MKLAQASAPITDTAWRDCSPYLQQALDKSKNEEWVLSDVRGWVDDSSGILLAGIDKDGEVVAAAVCGVIPYQRFSTLEIFLMGADSGSNWEGVLPEIIEKARELGCKEIRVAGRRWVKFLAKYGDAREMHQSALVL